MRLSLFSLFFLFVNQPLWAWTVSRSDIQGWQTTNLTIHFNPTNCPTTAADLKDVLDNAIGVWNGIDSSSLTVVRDTTDSTVTVSEFLAGTASEAPVMLCDPNFGSDNSVDPNGVPAVTRLGTGNPVSYGGILLNAQSLTAAEISNLDTTTLTITLAHELGHILGLGHSSLANALMYYSVSGKSQFVLTEDDRDGITFLYPKSEFKHGAYGCAAVHYPVTGIRDSRGLIAPLLSLLTISLITTFIFRRKMALDDALAEG